MPIFTDVPPPAAHILLDAAVASRLDRDSPLGLNGPATITVPIAHRRYVIRPGDKAIRFIPRRCWDYFVVTEDAVGVATIREQGKRLTFQSLAGGDFAKRLYQAVLLIAAELEESPIQLRCQVWECRAGGMMSVVAQSRNGRGYYVNVMEGSLVAENRLSMRAGIGTLKSGVCEMLSIRNRSATPRILE
jgi:hypothetical protein